MVRKERGLYFWILWSLANQTLDVWGEGSSFSIVRSDSEHMRGAVLTRNCIIPRFPDNLQAHEKKIMSLKGNIDFLRSSPSRLRGGMPLGNYFRSSRGAAPKAEEKESRPLKQNSEQIPIKWVVAGTVGGLCLLSSQIAHILVLGYGVCFPAYCR